MHLTRGGEKRLDVDAGSCRHHYTKPIELPYQAVENAEVDYRERDLD